MKIKNLIYCLLLGVFGGYLEGLLEKQINKRLKELETPEHCGGACMTE
jgi:hypothetical protein